MIDSDFTGKVNNHAQSISVINNEITEIQTLQAMTSLKTKQLEKEKYELIAHRGLMGIAPENTMAAFTLACSSGVNSLECDIRFTSDNVPVIIHDSTVDRTTTGTGTVISKTVAQIKSLDAGSKAFGINFSSVKIPTFEEFLKFANGRVNKIYTEIKDTATTSNITTLVNLIKNYNMEYKTNLNSFSIDTLDILRGVNKNIEFGFLSNEIPTAIQLDKLQLDGNSYLLVNYTAVVNNPTIISDCRSRGIGLGVWTVNNADDIKKLIDLGVYKIMSNYMFKVGEN